MANPVRWLWDKVTGLFARGRADGTIGAPIAAETTIAQRDTLIQAQRVYTERAAAKLASGAQTVNQWLVDFRVQLKINYVQEYMLGKGGKAAMTEDDWKAVGEHLQKQYEYMNTFAEEVKGGLSEGQIRTRMQMYFESSSSMYERAHAAARGVPRLPAYPADGSTQCRVNCHCNWLIEPREGGGWDCYWQLNPAEHCADCLDRAARWAPLVVMQ